MSVFNISLHIHKILYFFPDYRLHIILKQFLALNSHHITRINQYYH